MPKVGLFTLTLAFCAALSSAAFAAAKPFAADESWRNEFGSTLTVTSYNSNTGQIVGTYTTAVASPGCQAVGVPQAMVGWFNAASNAMTFSVNWLPAGCNSVTSWSGQLSQANGQITTIWTLTGATGWANMNLGTNTFSPLP
jgi:Avidin family